MSSDTKIPPGSTLDRFGVRNLVDSPDLFVGSMPIAGLRNPVTGMASVGPLAVLVDYVAGLVNHYRRAPDEWTVSTELSIDLLPDALLTITKMPDTAVVATARPLGVKGTTSVAECDLAVGEAAIGVGMVRSAHIRAPGSVPEPRELAVERDQPSNLIDIMALQVGSAGDGSPLLIQCPHPALNNTLGTVHGGVAAAGLELAAAAALNHDRREAPLHTASLRVIFTGRFFSTAQSRYTATILRRTKRSGVAEAQAIGAEGIPALTGWVTAYQ